MSLFSATTYGTGITDSGLNTLLSGLAINGYASSSITAPTFTAAPSNPWGLQARLNLPSAVTAAGTYIALFYMPVSDTGTAPSFPSSTSAAWPGNCQRTQFSLVNGGSFQYLEADSPIYIQGGPFIFGIQNTSGVAFPTGTATLTLYPFNDQVV